MECTNYSILRNKSVGIKASTDFNKKMPQCVVKATTDLGFKVYLLFTVSWFLHVASRIPMLGFVRLDLILILILVVLRLLNGNAEKVKMLNMRSGKVLNVLYFYILITLPFVEWPGSVIKFGIPNFIKAAVFYYFTIWYVTSDKKLKIFLTVFIICQCFRVIEPVYLHVTQGYWGSFATMANWEFMNRLSGAPSDILNPNGLAFVIVTTIPFLYFMSFVTWKYRIISIIILPILLYALVLTGSRSGIIGLFAILAGIMMKSKRRIYILLIFFLVIGAMNFMLTDDLRDRYASIFDSNAKNAVTANDRLEGVKKSLDIALNKPFIGHGLGTSREANANFSMKNVRAHNLWAELAQELGFIGLFIFAFYITQIVTNFSKGMAFLKQKALAKPFLAHIISAMQVWMFMNLLFSLASYGLSSYEWYLFGGLSVVVRGLAEEGLQPM